MTTSKCEIDISRETYHGFKNDLLNSIFPQLKVVNSPHVFIHVPLARMFYSMGFPMERSLSIKYGSVIKWST